MTISVKTLFAGAAVISVLAVAAPASAMLVIKPLLNGPFSLTNPLGSFPATKILKGNTYDFTMSFVQPLSGAVSSTQVSAQLLAKSQSTPELIQYSLYSGTPGSGSFLSQSTLDYSPTISFTPAVGDYYVELDYVAKINETVGGTITTASAPEPAAWAIMLVGFGALGGVMRRRNSMAAKFAA